MSDRMENKDDLLQLIPLPGEAQTLQEGMRTRERGADRGGAQRTGAQGGGAGEVGQVPEGAVAGAAEWRS